MKNTFRPEAITAEHIIEAIRQIDDGHETPEPSTIFDVVYKGKRYPPKGVMKIAHRLATGNYLWELPGGSPTNNLLKQRGFEIRTKGSDFTQRKNIWKIAPGERASLWDDFYNNGIMAVSFSENGVNDLRNFESLLSLEKAVGKTNSNEVKSLWICCHANKGDIVIANKGRNTVVGIGIIDGDYEFHAERSFPHIRKVKWLSNKEWEYTPGQFGTEQRKRPTLFRIDTLSKTEVGAEIIKAYLDQYPEYQDVFIENNIWPLFEDGSYDLLVSKAVGFANSTLINNYFKFLGLVFEKAGVLLNDERAFFSTPKSYNAISFTYDQRYMTYLQRDNKANTVFIAHKRGDSTNLPLKLIVKKGQFGGKQANLPPQLDYTIINVQDGSELNEQLAETVAVAIKEMMKAGKAYYFRHFHKNCHNEYIYKAATDSAVLGQLIFDIQQDDARNMNDNIIEIMASKTLLSLPLNTILFGPPGTGKTYNTINYAVSAIEGRWSNGKSRVELKQQYEHYREEGQIVFTTFHQSMSYEDFIEGIKPESNTTGGLTYEVQDGLFKSICELARSNWEQSLIGNQSQLTFEEAFERFQEEWDDNPSLTIPTKKKTFTITSISKKSIGFRKASGGTGHSLSINTLKEFYYNQREVFKDGLGVYYPGLVNKLKSYQGASESVALKNYVLIIDEINRGNVSQIFGELITLIEDNKRLGREEQLQVQLPYSQDSFGVPPNLYIIGTMNTADRSVEALDTALRRRFNFVEKKPDYELEGLQIKVAGFALGNILSTLNRRIEKLLDKDHQLGHSYLLNVGESNESLKLVFKNKFIPLLQEYFFGDYSRLGLVLGEKFFMPAIDDDNLFASFRDVDTTDFINRPTYQLRDLDLMSNDEFEEAIHVMMKKA